MWCDTATKGLFGTDASGLQVFMWFTDRRMWYCRWCHFLITWKSWRFILFKSYFLWVEQILKGLTCVHYFCYWHWKRKRNLRVVLGSESTQECGLHHQMKVVSFLLPVYSCLTYLWQKLSSPICQIFMITVLCEETDGLRGDNWLILLWWVPTAAI